MQLNSFFFPRPNPTYTQVAISLLPNTEIFYVSSLQTTDLQPKLCASCSCNPTTEPIRRIPVLLMKSLSDKYLLFFHSNSEDLKSCYNLLLPIQKKLEINIILVEYPGYGIYTSHQPSAEIITDDALAVYNYLLTKRCIPQHKIVVAGRSMGSGPATLIAAKFNPSGLILISAYTSLRAVAENIVGSLLAKLIKERFANGEIISKVQCPILVIHGGSDKLVPLQQAKDLLAAANSHIKQFHFQPDMTHNQFDYERDFEKPITNILKKIGFINEKPIQIQPFKAHQKQEQRIHTYESITNQQNKNEKNRRTSIDSYCKHSNNHTEGQYTSLSESKPNQEKQNLNYFNEQKPFMY